MDHNEHRDIDRRIIRRHFPERSLANRTIVADRKIAIEDRRQSAARAASSDTAPDRRPPSWHRPFGWFCTSAATLLKHAFNEFDRHLEYHNLLNIGVCPKSANRTAFVHSIKRRAIADGCFDGTQHPRAAQPVLHGVYTKPPAETDGQSNILPVRVAFYHLGLFSEVDISYAPALYSD
jgi:hypothetical protein